MGSIHCHETFGLLLDVPIPLGWPRGQGLLRRLGSAMIKAIFRNFFNCIDFRHIRAGWLFFMEQFSVRKCSLVEIRMFHGTMTIWLQLLTGREKINSVFQCFSNMRMCHLDNVCLIELFDVSCWNSKQNDSNHTILPRYAFKNIILSIYLLHTEIIWQ